MIRSTLDISLSLVRSTLDISLRLSLVRMMNSLSFNNSFISRINRSALFSFTISGLNLCLRILLYSVISISLINDIGVWICFFVFLPTTIHFCCYITIGLSVGCALYIGISLGCVLHIIRSCINIAFSICILGLTVYIGFFILMLRLAINIGFSVSLLRIILDITDRLIISNVSIILGYGLSVYISICGVSVNISCLGNTLNLMRYFLLLECLHVRVVIIVFILIIITIKVLRSTIYFSFLRLIEIVLIGSTIYLNGSFVSLYWSMYIRIKSLGSMVSVSHKIFHGIA